MVPQTDLLSVNFAILKPKDVIQSMWFMQKQSKSLNAFFSIYFSTQSKVALVARNMAMECSNIFFFTLPIFRLLGFV